MNKSILLFSQLILILSMSFTASSDQKQQASFETRSFGFLPSGEEIKEFVLINERGLEVKIISYGGIISALKTKNRNGEFEDIVLGFDSIDGYLQEVPYFGAIIGRYGNRIAKGKFSLDSVEYDLAINNIGNHLHGGLKGFDKVVWSGKEVEFEDGVALALNYTSKDMEEGYPGNLATTVTYYLGNDNSLLVDYKATTDKKTVVNLTQHSYFNLTGMKAPVLNHELMLNADFFLPVDSTLIPTGELISVNNTPFDFKEFKKIGQQINEEDQQLNYGSGYDHCWVLNDSGGHLKIAAKVHEPKSGRTLEVLTTEPGIQFYAGNFLDGTLTGKNGVQYTKRMGLCLETQHFPDSPNQPGFPSTELNPGEIYHSQTKFVFGVK